MTDVNLQLEADLADFAECECVYAYPQTEERVMPSVSYYTITEGGSFAADNAAMFYKGIVAIDVWAEYPDKCGRLAIAVTEHLLSKGWYLETAADVPDPERDVYHKHIRMSGIFQLAVSN